jgi:hypothetical protein
MTVNENALIIFTRNPELGKVKTRLARTIGDIKALQVYENLILHTSLVTQDLAFDKFVFYSDAITMGDVWDDTRYQKRLQKKGDLGKKMLASFREVFKIGYQKVVIIGCDVFDLRADHLRQAFIHLDTYDCVVGPAEDGGYYLLGMKTLHRSLFANKHWGGATVLAETLAALTSYKVAQLETLNDIDTIEDLLKNEKYSIKDEN